MRSQRLLVVVLFASASCVPDLVDETPTVASPRLLATRTQPPEARPGEVISTTSLWAGPDGLLTDAPLEWAFCTARKSFAEPGPFAASCLVAEGPDLIALGHGASASGTLPADACRRFGPDRPDPLPGETAGRPTDPDGTGGYYQPVRVLAGAEVSIASARLRCGLPDATAEQSMRFLHEYVANANPSITSLTRDRDGSPVELISVEHDETARATAGAGETLELSVSWPACEVAPCAGAEPYLWFDPGARSLISRREAIRVSWFATAGSFETSHSGRPEGDAATTHADNRWTAPASGVVYLWAVVRDDRGGATWATYRIAVE